MKNPILNYYKKTAFLVVVVLLHHQVFLFSQVKEPLRPFVPEINNNIDLQSFKFRARITKQGSGAPIDGVIFLNSDSLVTPDNMTIKLADISRITVVMWEKQSKLNKHTFYPVRYEFLFRDYKKMSVNGNIESLNKFKQSGRSGYLYMYYYDYYKNGKWINSGVTEFDSSISKPAEECVVSIELIQ